MRALYKTFILLSLLAPVALPPVAQAQMAPVYGAAASPGQIQQLVAPIALYPDDLLGQVLMASAYPLEVVEAQRWLARNPGLSGPDLTAALETQPWDPSVKALTAFPQVLSMMDSNLEWTERLGEAFMSDEAGVMDGVQQLRARAQSANRLPPPTQLSVSTENGYITISPAQPDNVYVPWYNPSTVFAPWPDPNYSPYYFPSPYAGYCYYSACWYSFAPVVSVYYGWWGWDHINWHHHHVHIDTHKWRELSSKPAPTTSTWKFDPSHRHGVPYSSPQLREHFQKMPPSTIRENRGFTAPREMAAPERTSTRASTATSWQEAAGGHRPAPPPMRESAPSPQAAQLQGAEQERDQSARQQRHQLRQQQQLEQQQERQIQLEQEQSARRATEAPAPVVPAISFHPEQQEAHGRHSNGEDHGHALSSPRVEPQRSSPPMFETMPSFGGSHGGGNAFGGGHEHTAPTPAAPGRAPLPTPERNTGGSEQGGDHHGH
jgi:hypothetical protein